MVLINCEVNLVLTWYENYVISDTKLHVLIVTLPTKDNLKLIKQLN